VQRKKYRRRRKRKIEVKDRGRHLKERE